MSALSGGGGEFKKKPTNSRGGPGVLKTPGGVGGARPPQSQNHLPFPKKRIFRLANRKLVESKALSPRSQLQDVTKKFAQ